MQADGSGGFFLLLTESFAVRAMLGSLAAAGLVHLAVRMIAVRSGRARRLLVLAPVTAAAVVGALSVGEAFLPRLWVATTTGGSAAQILDFLGESWFLTPQREIDVLVIGWALVAAILLARRLTGLLAVRRVLGRAQPPIGHGSLVPVVDRLASSMGIRTPQLLLLARCPGGALTARVWHPVVVLDPAVVDGLDDREVEGLLAHELAHISRRDNLVAGLIGVFRDLTFFLPPMHLAARWLRLEREESADELAARHTARPGALASSIIKVWDSCSIRRRAVGCAAVGGYSLALAGGRSVTALEAMEGRVERLLESRGMMSNLRRAGELGVAGLVTAAAVSTAIAVPAWMANRYDAAAIAVGYLTAPPVASVESPAFATFRQLAPERAATSSGSVDLEAPSAAVAAAECPCIESRTQWRDHAPAAPRHDNAHMAWGATGHEPWSLQSVRQRDSVRETRPLLTVSDPAQHFGFFVLGSAPQVP